MNRNHKRSPLLVLSILVVLILAAGFLISLFWIPKQVARNLGEADQRLSLFQRARYSLDLYRVQDLLFTAPNPSDTERKFTIEMDESVSSICARLEVDGYVSSGGLTCTYLIYSGLDRKIQSGTYTLSAQLNSLEIAQKISDARARDIVFTIFAGWRIEEIALSIDEQGFSFGGEVFTAFAYNPPEHILQALKLPGGASLEGYLFPGTYSLKPDTTLDNFIATLLTEFTIATQDPTLLAGIGQQNLNLHQAVTLASIIERETAAAEEKPTIASVFFNRLETGMMLQTDPTVQYAVGYDPNLGTWWKHPLTYEDLQVDSPYNTYLYSGLPPGPISNPSLETMQAVAFPVETPYFYFRAKCDGSLTHNFSVTYEEHLNYACQ
ncbi:MAG: endolytic transglycosylase MltG [Anaerolineaceae bacterium]